MSEIKKILSSSPLYTFWRVSQVIEPQSSGIHPYRNNKEQKSAKKSDQALIELDLNLDGETNIEHIVYSQDSHTKKIIIQSKTHNLLDTLI